jgi:phage shock protein C
MNTATANPQTTDHATQQLYRPAEDRMVAGVASGIARYLGVDVTAVRIILAVLTFVGGAGVPIYLAGWLLMPEEGAEHSIAGGFLQSRQARSL